MRWLGLAVLANCAGGSLAVAPSPGASGCPPPPAADAAQRLAVLFIDGRLAADSVPVRRTQEFPEAWEIVGPEPDAMRRIQVHDIEHISFASGSAAEDSHRLCPGQVAILITTRRGG